MNASIAAMNEAIQKIKAKIGGTPGVIAQNFNHEKTYTTFTTNEISIVLQDESTPYENLATAQADRLAVNTSTNHVLVVDTLSQTLADSFYNRLNQLKSYNGKPANQYTLQRIKKEQSWLYYYDIFAAILNPYGYNVVPQTITQNNNIQQVVPVPANLGSTNRSNPHVRTHVGTTSTPVQKTGVIRNTRNSR
jgi:hypothetical protein